MVERRSGLGWVLLIGFAFWIGCSDESAPPAAGSSALEGSGNAVTKPMSNGPILASPRSLAPPAAVPPAPSTEALIEAGRSVYNASCTACHSLDPTQDGALGPAVAGASLALLEARVLRAEYPDAYEPKRTTRVMIALPHLEPRLVELAAYLESLD